MNFEEGYKDAYIKVQRDRQRLIKQNKHYREALEFYAKRDNYKPEHFDPNLNNYMSTVDYDEGEKARQTLEEFE